MKKILKPKWLLFALAAVIISSCGNHGNNLSKYSYTVYNQSDNTLYFAEGFGAHYNGMNFYPDTSLPVSKPSLYIVRAHQSLPNGVNYEDWSTMFNSLPTDTLSIYIFSADALDNSSWNDIKTGYKILRRYDLSLEDIKKLDNKIYYPPTPEMQHMKMYPAYGN
jgi:hypothetical protein